MPAPVVPPPNLHYGMNAHDISAPVADRVKDLNAGVIRVVFGWDVIEGACKGCFDWSVIDAWRDQAKRTGRTIYATLAYTPRWANGGQTYNYPPNDIRDWYDFVFAAVDRYKDDIFLWGLWNEPNLDAYLKGADVATYRAIAATGRAAMRAANPSALALGPDVSHHAIPNGWFAAAMAAAGDNFDIVTVHWYRDGPPLEAMMDNVVRPLAKLKTVWLSEVGFNPCDSVFGEAAQAMFFQRVLEAWQPRRAWWTSIVFYDIYDPPSLGPCSSGITRFDWSNRPAFSLLQAYIRNRP